jgi:hypothetical protein
MNKRTPKTGDLLETALPIDPPADIAIDQSEPTPHERRKMLVAGTEDYLSRFPDDESAEEIVDRALAEGKVTLAVQLGQQEPRESETTIPAQYGIQVMGLAGGGVELRQESQFLAHDESDAAIDVVPHPAVALARKILEAAGFPDVVIQAGRDCEEIQDGQLSSQFDFRLPAPPPTPAPKPEIKIEPKPAPEPEPDIWKDDEAIAFQLQAATAIYRNRYDGLVIRQQAVDYHDDDPCVIIVRENIPAFIKRVTDVAAGRA